jgi:hypothetical protein
MEGATMFIDMTGRTGAEHARDLRRKASGYSAGRTGRRHHPLRALAARTELNPTYNYRPR